ncbi:hypothetical protein ACFLRW_06385, partial [Acidobacteriota bacterium]
KAILQYKKTIAMDPNFQMTYMYLNQAYFYNGMYKELLEEAEKWAENGIIPEETLNNFRMQCEFRMGRKEEFTQYFEKMKSVVPNMNKAIIYFVFGDVDQGFLFLEKAYEERYSELRFIKIEPEFDNIRSDPRYKEILRKMNLEE